MQGPTLPLNPHPYPHPAWQSSFLSAHRDPSPVHPHCPGGRDTVSGPNRVTLFSFSRSPPSPASGFSFGEICFLPGPRWEGLCLPLSLTSGCLSLPTPPLALPQNVCLSLPSPPRAPDSTVRSGGWAGGRVTGKDTVPLVLRVLSAQAAQVGLVAVQAPRVKASPLCLVPVHILHQGGDLGLEVELGHQECCGWAAGEGSTRQSGPL